MRSFNQQSILSLFLFPFSTLNHPIIFNLAQWLVRLFVFLLPEYFQTNTEAFSATFVTNGAPLVSHVVSVRTLIGSNIGGKVQVPFTPVCSLAKTPILQPAIL